MSVQIDSATIRFIEAEMFHVAPLPLNSETFPNGFNVQIINPENGSKTKWMSISAEQLHKIESILLGCENEEFV